jgi:broad specificity phosphatase PhoE
MLPQMPFILSISTVLYFSSSSKRHLPTNHTGNSLPFGLIDRIDFKFDYQFGTIMLDVKSSHMNIKNHMETSAPLVTPQTQTQTQTYYLYLIRHGEATHNILEQAAQQRAKTEAMAVGLDEEETQRRMELARMQVLDDASLLDASLSEQGRQDATMARQKLQDLLSNQQHQSLPLPPPVQVLVSPLTRTLETAHLIFPDHPAIHVREELRERCTGKPCDRRSPSASLHTIKKFRHFSMDRLRALSFSNSNLKKLVGGLQDVLKLENDDNDIDAIIKNTISSRIKSDITNCAGTAAEEDKKMLRERTRKLLELIQEPNKSNSSSNNNSNVPNSIAVVTHKGYLRELERGTFGKPMAREFANGEIRVYRVQIATTTTTTTRSSNNKDDHSSSLQYAERIV